MTFHFRTWIVMDNQSWMRTSIWDMELKKPSNKPTPNFIVTSHFKDVNGMDEHYKWEQLNLGTCMDWKALNKENAKESAYKWWTQKKSLWSLNIWMCGTNVSLGCQFRDPSVWGSILTWPHHTYTCSSPGQVSGCNFVCNKFKSEIVHDKRFAWNCAPWLSQLVVSDNQCNTGGEECIVIVIRIHEWFFLFLHCLF